MKRILGIVAALFVIALIVIYFLAFSGNIKNENKRFLYIPTGATYQQVCDSLATGFVKNAFSFNLIAQLKKYPELIKPGRYALRNGMNNMDLVDLLRAGLQSPIRVTVPSRKTYQEVFGKMFPKLEVDSAQLSTATENIFLDKGINEAEQSCYIIPNTYEFYWNASADQVLATLLKEKEKFWNAERLAKAKALKLTTCEVTTLASIVQRETAKADEMPVVAGVYLNRLRIGMRLQADPTLVFAIKDRQVKRVLNADKLIDSPYNTYKYRGLPPGPIYIPSITAIDAVLNAKSHNYIYFCAKEDFSGYHNFASSYKEHLQNARKYQQELNKRKIYQ